MRRVLTSVLAVCGCRVSVVLFLLGGLVVRGLGHVDLLGGLAGSSLSRTESTVVQENDGVAYLGSGLIGRHVG
jgi:hypothetical protein